MSKPQVIIVRKDKRIRHKFLHAAAFAVTGGASGLVTAAEAANHASYNARTRKLQEQAEGEPQPTAAERRQAEGKRVFGAKRAERLANRRAKVTFTEEERAYLAAHVPDSARKPR